MSSVKNRILQFQQNKTTSSAEGLFGVAISRNSRNNNSNSCGGGNGLINNIGNHREAMSTKSVPNQNTAPATPPPPPKKTSMTINLSSSSTTMSGGNNVKPPITKPALPPKSRTPTPTSSSIPKLITTGHGHGSTPTTTTKSQIYGSMDWKDKYEESEKKRLHIVSLAQKATRDYEELRQKFQDLMSENDKNCQKLQNSYNQLDSLQKASEAAYGEYYKLRKHYELENTAKADALSRVDEYNKENRRLKRQSAALLQQVSDSDPGSFNLENLLEMDGDCPEADKEVGFLRIRVQELESRVVDLETELEKCKLSEFEAQELALLDNAKGKSSNSSSLLETKLRESESRNSTLQRHLQDVKSELETLRSKEKIEQEKLGVVENELRKLQTEKKILQRQSMVFLSHNTIDAQLESALNEISDLQFNLEEQKLAYETQILELQDRINETESQIEAKEIQYESKVRSLENQVKKLQEKVVEAERKFDEHVCEVPTAVSPPPPPPPPPPPMCGIPPPPPPMMNSSGLGASIQNVTLRRGAGLGGSSSECSSGTSTPPNDPKQIVANGSTQIDDVVSEIKKGIKLRSTGENRNGTKKHQPEPTKNQPESIGMEEMRSILNNLKKTRRV